MLFKNLSKLDKLFRKSSKFNCSVKNITKNCYTRARVRRVAENVKY